MTGVRSALALKAGLYCLAVTSAALAMPAYAQDDDDIAPPRLPRPGYEYEGIQSGNTTIVVDTDLRLDYASNIFRVSENERDDVRAILSPSIAVTQQVSTGSFGAEVHAAFTRHAETERENTDTFGGSLALGLSPSAGRVFEAVVGYDRAIERRGDPEASIGPTDRPREIDIILAEATYSQDIGDLRLGLGIGAEKIDLLDPLDDDRDQTLYRASAKIGYNFSPAFDVYVEPYFNRRDLRLATDFTGIDRDVNTYGLLVGVEREIGNRLVGNVSVGLFQTDPESDLIPAYTGTRINTSVTWQPRTRTAVNFRLERGNAATVRAGATTRIDTIARIRVDQEIRHNLLGYASVSYIDRLYLGEDRGSLKTAGGLVGLEYLVNRRFSLFSSASYETRNSLDEIEEYNAFVFSVGVRTRL